MDTYPKLAFIIRFINACLPLFLGQITSFEEEMKCVADRPFVVTQDSYLPTVPMLRDSKYFHHLLLNQRKYKTSLKTEKEKKVRRKKEGERERELEGGRRELHNTFIFP